MIDQPSYTNNLSSCEIKAWKKTLGLNGIRTHDLCDTGAVLYQLCYQVIWELLIMHNNISHVLVSETLGTNVYFLKTDSQWAGRGWTTNRIC